MTPALTLAQAADLLHKSPRWLREWVRAHPADKAGEPFYTPVGRDKLFHPSDLNRIEQALREGMKCHSSSGRRAPAKRRTLKSEENTSESAWKLAAELTNDPSLLPSCGKSKNASNSTDATPPQKLSLIQGGRPS
jgi:hypothetical protein